MARDFFEDLKIEYVPIKSGKLYLSRTRWPDLYPLEFQGRSWILREETAVAEEYPSHYPVIVIESDVFRSKQEVEMAALDLRVLAELREAGIRARNIGQKSDVPTSIGSSNTLGLTLHRERHHWVLKVPNDFDQLQAIIDLDLQGSSERRRKKTRFIITSPESLKAIAAYFPVFEEGAQRTCEETLNYWTGQFNMANSTAARYRD